MVEQEHLIDLIDLTKEYDGTTVLDHINLYIRRKEFVTLLGPSGCGKTTTLRLIGGFETPTSGQVLFEGRDIQLLPPYKRRVNTVFQKYALFPHLNVFDNIAFGLKLKKTPRDEIQRKVDYMLDLVNLSGYGKRHVDALSGGQQQRVAIARALAMDPEILCFDEPTSALDPLLTQEVLGVIRALSKEKRTMIVVTHEMNFAREVADRVVFMEDGVIVAEGEPKDVFDSEKVKAFIGLGD